MTPTAFPSAPPVIQPPDEPEPPVPDGADLLKAHRVAAGLSQNRLARLARIDPAYVNRIEARRGRCDPSRQVVLKLIEALGLDLDAGDRLLFAFGLAPRFDWQAAWEQIAAEVPSAVKLAADRALADILRTTIGDGPDG